MEKITLYKDSPESFKCQIDIKGASLSESKARLVLEFSNGRAYMFKGNINSDGICEIVIPKILSEDDSNGVATLEVIAENSFFEPWKGKFELKNRKSVTVEGIQIGSIQQKSVTISNINSKKKHAPLVEKILGSFNRKNKKILSELNDYEPTRKVKMWAKKEFDNVNSLEARYTMMIIENRLKKKKRK